MTVEEIKANLLKKLESEKRQATPDEQEILAQYVGWGGLPDAFDDSKAAWAQEHHELISALTKEEYAAMLEQLPLLSEAGFEAEDFGNGALIVHACPMELSVDDVPEVLAEIAGRFVDKKQDVSFEKLDWIFHSVSCRSAIKAGNFTSRYEMERFAKQLLSMPEIRYCPHGRPVLIEMTQRELEKNFGRV